jgi:hypothetical protein
MSPEMAETTVSTISGLIDSNLGLISIFISLIVMGIWKEMIAGIIAGLQFRWSAAYPGEDDMIYILVGQQQEKARIQKIGIRSSSFYVKSKNTRLIVPNSKLKDLYIQKILPKSDD